MNDIKNINDWEVMTPLGWSNFSSIKKTNKDFYIKIIFDDDEVIKCSDSHKIKLSNGEFKYARNIKKGDVVQCRDDNKYKIVKSKRKINKKIALYDLLNVEKNNEFYTNNVISHNCAFIPNAEEVWVGANATTSTGGKAIILSTPNGVGDFFHKMWMDAESKNNGFITTSLPWHLHPERDQDWRDRKGAEQGDSRKAAQEFDCLDGEVTITLLDKNTNEIFSLKLKELYNFLSCS